MRRLRLPTTTLVGFFLMAGVSHAAGVKFRTFTQEEIDAMQKTQAVIHTKFGDMTLKFFPDVAPNHVDNFITLSKSGSYNGTIFHRVIPDFVIQGGDPNSKDPANRAAHGTGGPGYSLKAEFNSRPHKRGTLSMARSQNPNSAGSQFYICVADVPHLDNQYTVFGEVVSGIEVVDKITAERRDGRDNPLARVEMKIDIIGGAGDKKTE